MLDQESKLRTHNTVYMCTWTKVTSIWTEVTSCTWTEVTSSTWIEVTSCTWIEVTSCTWTESRVQ